MSLHPKPLLRESTGYSASAVPWLLVVFGAGLFAGNILGGRAADRNPDNAVVAILLPVVILALVALAGAPILVAIATGWGCAARPSPAPR